MKALSLLLSALFVASCGVSEPDATPWKNVGAFSWPTTVGRKMSYQKLGNSPTVDSIAEVTVKNTVLNQQNMYLLSSSSKEIKSDVTFLPSKDTLFVDGEKFGGNIALLAPLEKGHSWISSDDGTTYWQVEILELFAYKNVEGRSYKNVVAVKYVKHWYDVRPSNNEYSEWIRFYAEGVGEILTINNVIPNSTSTNTLPVEDSRTFLISDIAN